MHHKFFCYLFAPLLLLIMHLPAQAGFKFGTSERIDFVANITLKGPQGERLYLGRKISEKSFLLPYSIVDQGFVLGISGETKRYFPMPEGEQLARLQEEGFLPKQLPVFTLSMADKIFGNYLWFALVAIALYLGYLRLVRKKIKIPALFPFRMSYAAPNPRALTSTAKLPMTLYPSRRRAIFFIAVSMVFVLGGIMLIPKNLSIGLQAIGFFGLSAAFFAFSLRRSHNYLALHRDHFRSATIFKNLFVKWRDIEEFRVVNVTGKKCVAWTYRANSPAKKLSSSSSRMGFDASLGDNYGMDVEELAELMADIAAMDAARRAGERLEGQ